MNNGAELIDALKQIEKEKGIEREIIFEAIESSLVTACKKNFGASQNVKVIINRENGNVKVFAQKEVVEEVENTNLEISLSDAKEINTKYELGDIADVVVTPKNFGRISAQTAKQVVVQKFREAERELLYNEFIEKEKDIITGIVQRQERRNIIISLGKTDAILSSHEQIPGEKYVFNERIKLYVVEVKQTTKGPQIIVSRTHPELVKRLFEQEVPEIFDGTVEIKSIAREAGSRTKIAVHSKNPNVDAVGSCVGPNGYRVNIVVNELKGEKIDIINWSENPREFIASALSPSNILAVAIDEEERSAKVVAPDNQLSLAIGKEGQNARLAARLTGWRIDIKSESQADEMGFVSPEDYFDYVADDDYEKDYEDFYGEDENGYDDSDEDYEDEEYDDDELEEEYDDEDYDDEEYEEDEFEEDYDDDEDE